MSLPLLARFLTWAQGSRVAWAATREAAVERRAERASRRVMAVKCKDSLIGQQDRTQNRTEQNRKTTRAMSDSSKEEREREKERCHINKQSDDERKDERKEERRETSQGVMALLHLAQQAS